MTTYAPGEYSAGRHTPGEAADFQWNDYWGQEGIGLVAGARAKQRPTATKKTVSTKSNLTPAVDLPPRPAPIYSKEFNNKGWNSWARSVNPIPKGSFVSLTVSAGVEAIMFGIGPKGMEGMPIARFSHSVIVNHRGIIAHEAGVNKGTIKSLQLPSSKIRVYHQTDGQFVYTVVTATETLLYASDSFRFYPNSVYVYGMIYSANDLVTSAEISTGTVHFGSA